MTGLSPASVNVLNSRRTSGNNGRDSIRSFSEAVNQGISSSKKRTLSRSGRGSNFEFLTSTSQSDTFSGRGAVRSLSLPIDPNIKLLKGNRVRTISNSSMASTEPLSLFESEYEGGKESTPTIPPRKNRSASSSDIHSNEIMEDRPELLTRHLSIRGRSSGGDPRLTLPIEEEVIFDENDQQSDKPPPLPPKRRPKSNEMVNPHKLNDEIPPPLPPRDFTSSPRRNRFCNVHFMDNGDIEEYEDVQEAPLPPPRLLNRNSSKHQAPPPLPPPPLPPRPDKT